MSDPELPSEPRALKALLRELAPRPPANPELDNGPWDFITRAPAPEQERVRPLAHELLVDGDTLVRLRALELLMALPSSAATIARLVEVAGGHSRLYGDEERLRERLEHALANVCEGSGREREIARLLTALAGQRLPALATATVLGQREPDFAADLVARFAGSDGADRYCVDVASMFARYHRDRLLSLLARLTALSPEGKQAVLAQLAEDLALPEATIAWLTSQSGLPAPGPAPSLDACRSALG